MEKKYNPGKIHLHTGTYIASMIFKTQALVMDDEFYSKVIIFIEIMGSDEEGYIIMMREAKGPIVLLKGAYTGGTVRIIADPDALYNDKDLLGKVTIYYNRRIVKEFPNFEKFWKAIER